MSYMYGVVCDKAEGRSVNSDRVVHLIKECMAKPSSKDKPRAALTKGMSIPSLWGDRR